MEIIRPPRLLQHLQKGASASGVFAVALGAAVLAWPGKTILVAAIIFGAYLLIAGLSQVVLALSLKLSWTMRILPFASGVVAVALAVLCFLTLQNSILLLAIWIGVGFIFCGVATATSAFGDNLSPGRLGQILVGALSSAAGIVTLATPSDSIAVVSLTVGILLIVVGACEVIVVLRILSVSRKSTRAAASSTVSTTKRDNSTPSQAEK